MKRQSSILAIITAFVMVAFVMGSVQEADARFILTLEDLGAPGSKKTIIDNASGDDSDPTVGVISYLSSLSGPVGVFSINVTTGLTKPHTGPMKIDLSSVTVSSGQAGKLDIWLTDTDFTVLPFDELFVAPVVA